MKTKRKGKILVEHGTRKQLHEETKASLPTIKKALDGYENTATQYKIRQRALELGGVLVETKED